MPSEHLATFVVRDCVTNAYGKFTKTNNSSIACLNGWKWNAMVIIITKKNKEMNDSRL